MKKIKDTKNILCELHSNLMLATTVVAMLVFVILMIIYMGMKNPALAETAIGAAKFGSVLCWVATAILAYNSIKKHTKYLLEYIVYLIVAGFVFLFMFNAPFNGFFMVKHGLNNWAHDSLIVLTVLNGIFFVVSVVIHGVFANRKKN